MTPIKREKDVIRKDCSDRRNAIDKEEHRIMDEQICSLALSLNSFRYADVVLLYAPIKSEIDVMPLFYEAIKQGKRVAFPRCNVEDRTMKFHFVEKEEDMSPCAYGIREPREDSPVFDPERYEGNAICFVPGLAFDVYGYRLGYGKGYYDKFMNVFSGSTIGVVYADFILSSLPRGKFDKHCNVMLTEKGIKVITKTN